MMQAQSRRALLRCPTVFPDFWLLHIIYKSTTQMRKHDRLQWLNEIKLTFAAAIGTR